MKLSTIIMKMLIKAVADLPKTLQSNNKEENNLTHLKKKYGKCVWIADVMSLHIELDV